MKTEQTYVAVRKIKMAQRRLKVWKKEKRLRLPSSDELRLKREGQTQEIILDIFGWLRDKGKVVPLNNNKEKSFHKYKYDFLEFGIKSVK